MPSYIAANIHKVTDELNAQIWNGLGFVEKSIGHGKIIGPNNGMKIWIGINIFGNKLIIRTTTFYKRETHVFKYKLTREFTRSDMSANYLETILMDYHKDCRPFIIKKFQ